MPEAVLYNEWNRIVVPHISPEKRELGELVLAQTIENYGQTGREQHTLPHIIYGHEQLSRYESRSDYLSLWLAYLWHDLDYTIGPKNKQRMSDEKESAKKAYCYMESLGLAGAYLTARVIVATETHDWDVEPEALINAIDMSILAAPASVYDGYSVNIRKENDWVPEDVYYPARMRVLQNFPRPIFRHPDFLHLEAPAEENITREIARIEAIQG